MIDESWMWGTLNGAMKNRWRAERMQSSFAPGLADVCFTMFPSIEHECGWMELKVIYEIPEKSYSLEPLKIPHYNAAQKDWLMRRKIMGQPTYFMAYSVPTNEWLLLDGTWRDGTPRGSGSMFHSIGKSMALLDLQKNSPWRSDSLKDFAVATLTDLLSDGSKVMRPGTGGKNVRD